MEYCFPFGQPLKIVEQTDRTPKEVFVLGVYASAVHARWINRDGRDVVKALAVASEPYIFWRGDDADSMIEKIKIPSEAGRLVAAERQFNGPSGIALDELFLRPLGLDRDQAWLCDLVPHSCLNPSQSTAIDRAYLPLIKLHNLCAPTIPPVPGWLADEPRQQAILNELRQSQAKVLILLGDQPIKWFLHCFDKRWRRLSDFENYGQLYSVSLDGFHISVMPLAHPRQVAQLGLASRNWFEKHQQWLAAKSTL